MGLYIGMFVTVVVCFGIMYYTNNLENHEKTENTELFNDGFRRLGCLVFILFLIATLSLFMQGLGY